MGDVVAAVARCRQVRVSHAAGSCDAPLPRTGREDGLAEWEEQRGEGSDDQSRPRRSARPAGAGKALLVHAVLHLLTVVPDERRPSSPHDTGSRTSLAPVGRA